MQELHKHTDHAERLFTIFCRCDEAVYVSQFAAIDVQDAVNIWVSRELPSVIDVTEQATVIAQELQNDEPLLVKGCTNVWTVSAFPVWLDLVATAAETWSEMDQ